MERTPADSYHDHEMEVVVKQQIFLNSFVATLLTVPSEILNFSSAMYDIYFLLCHPHSQYRLFLVHKISTPCV